METYLELNALNRDVLPPDTGFTIDPSTGSVAELEFHGSRIGVFDTIRNFRNTGHALPPDQAHAAVFALSALGTHPTVVLEGYHEQHRPTANALYQVYKSLDLVREPARLLRVKQSFSAGRFTVRQAIPEGPEIMSRTAATGLVELSHTLDYYGLPEKQEEAIEKLRWRELLGDNIAALTLGVSSGALRFEGERLVINPDADFKPELEVTAFNDTIRPKHDLILPPREIEPNVIEWGGGTFRFDFKNLTIGQDVLRNLKLSCFGLDKHDLADLPFHDVIGVKNNLSYAKRVLDVPGQPTGLMRALLKGGWLHIEQQMDRPDLDLKDIDYKLLHNLSLGLSQESAGRPLKLRRNNVQKKVSNYNDQFGTRSTHGAVAAAFGYLILPAPEVS